VRAHDSVARGNASQRGSLAIHVVREPRVLSLRRIKDAGMEEPSATFRICYVAPATESSEDGRQRAQPRHIGMIPSWLGRLTDSIRHVSPSDVAAWWGAIAATMVLIWNLLRAVRLKGRLKVEAIYRGDSRQPHLPPVLAVRVTNVGSKPVLVQGVAVQRTKGSDPSHYFFPCDTPKMLARRKFFEEALDQTGWLPLNTEKIYVWDSTGAHWYMPRKELRRLLDSYRRWHMRAKSEQQPSRSEGTRPHAGS